MRTDVLRNFPYLLVSLIASLLLAEAALRIIDGQYQKRRSDWSEEFQNSDAVHPHYPTELTTSRGVKVGGSGYVRFQLNPYMVYGNLPLQREPHFTINSKGFRGPEILSPGLKYRIFITGGSTAFGTGLPSDDNALNRQLEALVPVAEVINAAVIGHSSGQELALTTHQLMDLTPNLLISLSGWNDAYYGYSNPSAPFLGFNNLEQIEDRLRDYFLVTEQTLPLRIGSQIRLLIFPAISKRLIKASKQPLLASPQYWKPLHVAHAYASNMSKLRHLAEQSGAKFLCLLQPDIRLRQTTGNKDLAAYTEYYRDFVQEVSPLLRSLGINFVDLNQVDSLRDPDLYLDAIHLNSAGYRTLAHELKDLIGKIRQSHCRNPSAQGGSENRLCL